MDEREKIMSVWTQSLETYCATALRIFVKGDRAFAPFRWNAMQRKLHADIEEQRGRIGKVRVIILKARQLGCSTYIAARNFWAAHLPDPGARVEVLAHTDKTAKLLARMYSHFWERHPVAAGLRRERLQSNAHEERYDSQGEISVRTTSTPRAGRGGTVSRLHGSEVAYWEHAEAIVSGSMDQVDKGRGSEIALESTANGPTGFFHGMYQAAVAGENEFKPLFYPWTLEPAYRETPPVDFQLGTEPPNPVIPSEAEYARRHGVTDAQMYWRRLVAQTKGAGTGIDGWMEFAKEYPITPEEAFLVSSDLSFMAPVAVARVCGNARMTLGMVSGYPLIVGVDPATSHGPDESVICRRRGPIGYKWETSRTWTEMEIIGRLLDINAQENPALFVIDRGMGDGIVTALENDARIGHKIVGVFFGGASFYPERYANQRAEMYDGAREWMNRADSQLPDDAKLKGELLSIRRRSAGEKQLQLERKEDMRKRGVPSPGRADAFVLTHHHSALGLAEDPTGGEVEYGGWDPRGTGLLRPTGGDERLTTRMGRGVRIRA